MSVTGWAVRPLGDLIELQRGHDLPSQDRRAGSVPILGSFGVTGFHDTARYEGPGVAVGRSGGSMGTASYTKESFWPLNTCLFVKDFKGNDPRWVFRLLDGLDFASFNSGSAQPSLNRNVIRSLPVLTPPLVEQRAIAEVLGALDDKIAANTKLAGAIEDVLEAETSLMWLDAESSDLLPITEILDLNPSTPKPGEAEPLYIDMKKLPEAGSGISGWERRKAKGGTRFVQGDTLMARITPCLENRKTGFVDSLAPGQVGIGSTEFIALRSKEPYAKPLSYFLAIHPDFRDFAIRHMVGSSGRQRVSARDLASYSVPAPDQEWVNDFGVRATKQFEYTKSLRKQNRTLAATRDALLPQLMSGRLRVKDAERVAEEVV